MFAEVDEKFTGKKCGTFLFLHTLFCLESSIKKFATIGSLCSLSSSSLNSVCLLSSSFLLWTFQLPLTWLLKLVLHHSLFQIQSFCFFQVCVFYYSQQQQAMFVWVQVSTQDGNERVAARSLREEAFVTSLPFPSFHSLTSGCKLPPLSSNLEVCTHKHTMSLRQHTNNLL